MYGCVDEDEDVEDEDVDMDMDMDVAFRLNPTSSQQAQPSQAKPLPRALAAHSSHPKKVHSASIRTCLRFADMSLSRARFRSSIFLESLSSFLPSLPRSLSGLTPDP